MIWWFYWNESKNYVKTFRRLIEQYQIDVLCRTIEINIFDKYSHKTESNILNMSTVMNRRDSIGINWINYYYYSAPVATWCGFIFYFISLYICVVCLFDLIKVWWWTVAVARYVGLYLILVFKLNRGNEKEPSAIKKQKIIIIAKKIQHAITQRHQHC